MRIALTLLAAAALTAGTLAPPAVAAPVDHPHRLSAQAQAAGLTPAGGGRMGWHQRPGAAPTSSPTAVPSAAAGSVAGIDVASYQRSVDWASYWGQGKRFAYVKATEGTSYTNPSFSQQYGGSYSQGFIRGAYHFALPNGASGAAQAEYFVGHGGGWSADGTTLPGVLDIEYNPYSGGTCYGLSAAQVVAWISDFTTTYRSLTGRDAVIYSTTDWWTTCTGNSTAFGATNPLWIARYAAGAGTLPAGWGYYTFWQYSSTPVDQDTFNGDESRLGALALG